MSSKDKIASMELELTKRQNKIKDLQNDKMELEKKNSFFNERIDSMEKELQRTQNILKEAKQDESRDEGGLLTESMKADMREKIKVLEKENSILKQQIENNFDKDRIMIQSKLSDKVRENKGLAETNEMMKERLTKLEEKLTQAMSYTSADDSSSSSAKKQEVEEMT